MITNKMEIDVTDETFKKEVVERSDKIPVLVDFWATWCYPCQVLKPILERLAKEQTNFVLAKVNVDENQETAQKYGIMSIPSVKLFKKGEIALEFVGLVPEEEIIQLLKENL